MSWIMICADTRSLRFRNSCGFEETVKRRDWHCCPRCGGTMITKEATQD